MSGIQKIVDAYLAAVTAGDVDAVMALFADEASVEDPVGSVPVVGRDEVRAFYERAFEVPMRAEASGPAGLADAAVAFPFRLTLAGGATIIDIIDVFHLDADRRITSMRAYWGPGNVHT